MNPKQLVRLSNIIGVISILLLIYWVITFITIEVFGLKIFRENLTQTFYMSIVGILALMAGALIVNIMFNLTRIAQKHNSDKPTPKTGRRTGWILLASIPFLLLVLFAGDYLTSKKKERLLVRSANSILKENERLDSHLLNYRFDEEWIVETEKILGVLSKTDENLPFVSVVMSDSLDGESAYLRFTNRYRGNLLDTTAPKKEDFIWGTTKEERDYLRAVFDEGETDYRYSAHDGRYELFYPYSKEGKSVVLYFSEYQSYGKIGS